MSPTSVPSGDSSWEELRCPLDDYVEPHDDTYYDDSRLRADDNVDTIEDYAQDSYPYDPERDDPLRHEGVPEEEIAKVVVDDYLKTPDIARHTALETVRILTTKILRVSDVVFSDHLPAPTEQTIESQIVNHGLDSTISKASLAES
ncbi:hypothetical protein ASPCAL00268 [Aspergillus calidoustus]|uniref:Uncharacterized protein n=1 Tax=Aspergillus calidoustus TaxID=454130 RepID=A0A0U5FR21_ASPCI|nr:hypothetical protein ASPCAL00268 [Aspergillus calidoustus]